jgi:protein-disulfide isomerase
MTLTPTGKWIIMGAIALAAAVGTFWLMQGAGSSVASNADTAVAEAGFDPKDRKAIEAIIRDYILTNPEIIPEAVEVLQNRQRMSALGPLRESIERPFAGNGFAGNPNGDVVMVEFSDFACPYCRSNAQDVDRLIQSDPNVKVVFRELPILSPQSEQAALMALAAASQGKYYAFHKAMFAAGRPSDATIAQAARAAGLDMEAAARFAASPEAKAEIEANKAMIQKIPFGQGFGTPAWIVGDEIAVGAVGYSGLVELVGKARQRKQAAQ